MQKSKSENENESVPETIFKSTAAECFLLFEQYRLKTHIVGSNIDKNIFYQCYESLQGRIIDRYSLIFEQLQRGISELQRNFILAKASNLRALNNILRNHRRRVGTLSNQPLSNFKYNKYDKYEKMLMECLVYTDRQNYLELLQFKEELTFAIGQGDKEISEKYKSNDKIKDSYKKMMEVVDKSQCYCFKYYENFERSMITTINTLQNCFEKLNTYLTVWQNVGSTKAYQSKSQKQRQMQQKTQDGMYSRKFLQQETEEHLEQLYNSCPPHSAKKQEYRKKLNQLRKYNAEKQKKLDSIGKMFNKRKNRAGILVSRYRDLSVLDWYFNIQGNRANLQNSDQFKNYTSEPDNLQNQFKPTAHEVQRPFKKDRLDQIKQHLQKNQAKSNMNYEWQYDRYGKDGVFDLIECGSQLVQKRIQFQIVRQIELQNSDDRRKRDHLEKQNYHIREIQRKEGLHIGFVHFQENQELQWLNERDYDIQYLPQLLCQQNSQDSFNFSDQEKGLADQQIDKQVQQELQDQRQNQQKIVQQVKKQSLKDHHQMAPLVKLGNQKIQQQNLPGKQEEQLSKQSEREQEQREFQDMCLQEQIITSYFKEFSSKVLRKQSEPQYKQTKFLFYPTIQSINWGKVNSYFQCEKLFISTKNSIVFLTHIFSSHQKIKGFIYTLDQELQEDSLRQNLTTCFANLALVTIKFFPIYTELDQQSLAPFMIGLLLVLLRQNEMPEDYQNKDYIQKGKEIIEDYNSYYYPEQYKASLGIQMRRKTFQAKDVFKVKKQESLQYQPDQQILSVSSKNASTKHSMHLNRPTNIQHKQFASFKKQNNPKKEEKITIQAQNDNPVAQPSHLQDQQPQKQLKRQNSREFPRAEAIQFPIVENQQRQTQKHEGEQQDYQSL